MAHVAVVIMYNTIQTGVYTLILYSMIGYDWIVAKFLSIDYSMLTSFIFHVILYDDCGLDTKLSDRWDLCPSSLVSRISSPVYSDQDRYVANNNIVEMVLLGIHQWLGRCTDHHILSRRQRFDIADR